MSPTIASARRAAPAAPPATAAAPLLTVVVPAYNVAPWFGDAVRSALGQTMPDLEVVVVDDGSTDATPLVLAGIRDPRLRVVRQANAGLAAARNAGIRAARASFFGLLDGDDVWMPGKAERQLAALERAPEATLTYSHSAYLDASGRPDGTYLLSRLASPSLRQMILRNHVGNGSTPIGRTADFLAAGLFDVRLRTALEDYEMWPRLMHRTGRGLLLVLEVLTGYRVRGDSLSQRFDGFLRHAEMARTLLPKPCPTCPRTCSISASRVPTASPRGRPRRLAAPARRSAISRRRALGRGQLDAGRVRRLVPLGQSGRGGGCDRGGSAGRQPVPGQPLLHPAGGPALELRPERPAGGLRPLGAAARAGTAARARLPALGHPPTATATL